MTQTFLMFVYFSLMHSMHIFKSKKLRESRIPSNTSLWIICLEICPKYLYHNQGLKIRDISPKYRISKVAEMKLGTDYQLGKKLGKIDKISLIFWFWANISTKKSEVTRKKDSTQKITKKILDFSTIFFLLKKLYFLQNIYIFLITHF